MIITTVMFTSEKDGNEGKEPAFNLPRLKVQQDQLMKDQRLLSPERAGKTSQD